MTRTEVTVSLGAAAIAGVAALVGCAFGFGSYLRVGWVVLVPALLLLSGTVAAILACILATPRPLHVGLVAVLCGIPSLVVGWFGGAEIRLMKALRVARRAEPLIQAIEEHRRSTGQWPSALVDVKGWNDLAASQGLFVQHRERRTLGLDVTGIGDADVTVYLGPNGYLAVIPIEKVVPMSITSFAVLLRGDANKSWEEDRITWLLSVGP